jgi:hypothetical protein
MDDIVDVAAWDFPAGLTPQRIDQIFARSPPLGASSPPLGADLRNGRTCDGRGGKRKNLPINLELGGIVGIAPVIPGAGHRRMPEGRKIERL